MKVLILGVNGFIGSHLSERILQSTDWEVYGMDLGFDKISHIKPSSRFHYVEGDIAINREWIEYHIKKSDVVLPLVAIATPKSYIENPLGVFELDFEENLRIIKLCVKYHKRVIFPSTSEVYGMCSDEGFAEYNSSLVMGPSTNKGGFTPVPSNSSIGSSGHTAGKGSWTSHLSGLSTGSVPVSTRWRPPRKAPPGWLPSSSHPWCSVNPLSWWMVVSREGPSPISPTVSMHS